MSLSTQALPIKPKTGGLPSWNMRVTAQPPWLGGGCCQVSLVPEQGLQTRSRPRMSFPVAFQLFILFISVP